MRKSLNKKFSNTVKSIFNIHDHDQYLNYWNLNQTFYIKGVCDKHNISDILYNLYAVQKEHGFEISEELQVELANYQEVQDNIQILQCRSAEFMA